MYPVLVFLIHLRLCLHNNYCDICHMCLLYMYSLKDDYKNELDSHSSSNIVSEPYLSTNSI